MTVIFRRTFTRPNASVPFYADPTDFTQYIQNKYVNSGQCLVWRDIAENSTTRIAESTWASKEDLDVALLDAEILINNDLTKQYCTQNSIATKIVIV